MKMRNLILILLLLFFGIISCDSSSTNDNITDNSSDSTGGNNNGGSNNGGSTGGGNSGDNTGGTSTPARDASWDILKSNQIKSMETIVNTAVFLLSNNEIYTTGSNIYGELGIGDAGFGIQQTQKLLKVNAPDNRYWDNISVGNSHILALTNEGELYVWGSNSYGQLGLGDSGLGTNRFRPNKVSFPEGVKIKKIHAGYDFSLAVTDSNDVYLWGSNSYKQLGFGDSVDRYIPTKNISLSGLNIKRITSSSLYSHSVIVLTGEGDIYGWGRNDNGELGFGDKVAKDIPTKLPTTVKFTDISLGDYHALAVSNTGKLYSWGDGLYGKLGLGDAVSRYSPTEITSLPTVRFRSVATGINHSLALTTDNKLYSWGLNDYGQLGLGYREESSNKFIPTLVSSPVTSWRDITTGGYGISSSIATDFDGVSYIAGYLYPLISWWYVETQSIYSVYFIKI